MMAKKSLLQFEANNQFSLGFLGLSNKPTMNFSVFSQGNSTKMKSTADNRQQ